MGVLVLSPGPEQGSMRLIFVHQRNYLPLIRKTLGIHLTKYAIAK